jgi:hypothetical protein
VNAHSTGPESVLDTFEFYESVSLMTPASRMVAAPLNMEGSYAVGVDDAVRQVLPVVDLCGTI